MTKLVSLGAFGLLGALAFSACSSDEDDGPAAGSGGVAGSTGNAGTGGAAGGGAGGVAGSGGAAGNTGGPTVECTGCVELTLPVTAADQAAVPAQNSAIYNFTFPAPGVDLSEATITWRVQVLTPGATFFLQTSAQNGTSNGFAGNYVNYTAITDTAFPAGQWVDVVQNLAALQGPGVGDAGVGDAGGEAPGDAGVGDAGDAAVAPPPATGVFDKSRVESVAIQLGAIPPNVGSATIVIDSVTFTGVDATAVPNKTFDTGVEGLTLNTYQAPAGATAPVAH
ncbi:MAG: hypothetical protein ABW217_15050 [Polyangiaceae bacterium]